MQSKAGGGLSGDAVELPKAPRVYKGCTRDTQGIPKGYPRDTQGIPKGYPRDTQGMLKGYPRDQHRANTVPTPEQYRASALCPRDPSADGDCRVSGKAASLDVGAGGGPAAGPPWGLRRGAGTDGGVARGNRSGNGQRRGSFCICKRVPAAIECGA